MDIEIKNKFEEQDQKLDAIYSSVEKTRKYFLWTLIISAVFIVLPLVGLAFVIPTFIDNLSGGGLL